MYKYENIYTGTMHGFNKMYEYKAEEIYGGLKNKKVIVVEFLDYSKLRDIYYEFITQFKVMKKILFNLKYNKEFKIKQIDSYKFIIRKY